MQIEKEPACQSWDGHDFVEMEESSDTCGYTKQTCFHCGISRIEHYDFDISRTKPVKITYKIE